MATSTLLIDKTIKKIEYIFRVAGINIKVENKTIMDNYRSWAVSIFNFVWANTDIGGAMVWFIQNLVANKSFTELVYIGPCVTISHLGNVKAFCMFTNEAKIDLLIANIRKLEIKQREREGNAETEEIIKAEDDYLNKVIRILNIFYIVLLIGFAFSPILLVLLKYYTTNEVELLLPFLVVYPFDPFDMRYYPWVYLHQIWSEIVVIFGVCSADFMFYIFCAYLKMQFDLLKYYIEHIVPSDAKIIHDQEEMKMKLVKLVEWHLEIKSSADVLESLYTRSTLFNCIASSLLICLTGFNVMVLEDIAFVITFACFLFMSFLQIYYLCFFGDMLMESSVAVSDAVYNSRWYLTERSFAKSLILIQTRAQIPCKLTAFKFADVNLKSFMRICSTAWSYFALLQTLYTGPSE